MTRWPRPGTTARWTTALLVLVAACLQPWVGSIHAFDLRTRSMVGDTLPELVAPGTLSTGADELGASFTPDGGTVYYTVKAGAEGQRGVIVFRRRAPRGRWSAPRVASFSGRYADYDPAVTPDGTRLFFVSSRPHGPAAGDDSTRRDFDVWVVERRPDGGWGAPRNVGTPVNGERDELFPSVTADGTLYFTSCGRSDTRGRCDLYRAPLRDGRYAEVENLGDAVNTAASETDGFVTPDERLLVFAAYGRPDEVGRGDLYVSERRDGHWSRARPLGARVNSVARDYAPTVSHDGAYLYFTSQRGFVDAPAARPLTYGELRDSLRAPRNGLGDLYRIPVAALGVAWPARR